MQGQKQKQDKNIRNFSIIAHIDHGKSTLADRLLEFTNTVEKRKMKAQVLDSMDLERERGITIKMQPVSMNANIDGVDYNFNLIDTPGHIDFSYEVSRALKAVEGAILLVDATQGVQAQTLSTLGLAREMGLTIIPALSKVDSPLARIDEIKAEIAKLLEIDEESIINTSGKTGEGVAELLSAVVKRIPSPDIKHNKHNVNDSDTDAGALIFDFQYSNHQGIIVFVRVFDGELKRGDQLLFKGAKEKFNASEVGVFVPDPKQTDILTAGEIGYIVTGIKKPGVALVGDTITDARGLHVAFEGYMSPKPVVWASVYPESQDDFTVLQQSLDRLRLTDSSLSYEEEQSGILGRGFRCGFLGMLHLEIISERLKREFDLNLIITTPSITYEVTNKDGSHETIYTPVHFPDHGDFEAIREPWVLAHVITPTEYVGNVMQFLHEHEAILVSSESFGDNRMSINIELPLRELMRNFFDNIKSTTSGYASLSYDICDMRPADVTRLDIMIGGDVIPAFSRIVARRKAEDEAQKAVEKLYEVLPRQQFVVKIQGVALGRIISSKTLSAFRKDVTAKLYGGDITRKMKLREKQKKGKKKMREKGSINIPHDVFLKMMRQ